MKLRAIFFIALFFVSQLYADPLLVVVLMVKNEASVIEATLQPMADGGIKDFVIFDTGSTDGTQDIAQKFFMQNGLNGYVVEEPFINFAASRNNALAAAESIFPQATFMLMPDAEWYIYNAQDLLKFCQEHKDDTHDCYLVSLRSSALAFSASRLIRVGRNVKFVGRVHEVLNQVTVESVPSDVYFEWRPCETGCKKSAQRWLRDRDLLLQDHEQNPFDVRTLFYLGQTYDCLGDWENAYKFYKKRAAIHGWDEENFMTRMRLGSVAEHLNANDDKDICPLAVKHYLEAFSMRPSRAEPLIKIAEYYLGKKEFNLSLLFSARAVQIPYPKKDLLFVEKRMYDFTRYDLLGIAAWYTGDHELGEWAVRKALDACPDMPHLHDNLKWYLGRYCKFY